MQSLIFAVNAVAPILLTVVIGYFLKNKYITKPFARAANRLVFHVFLPAMLFLNIYKIEDISTTDFRFALYAAAMLIVIFLIALLLVPFITKEKSRKGVLLQAAFRSNYALIGIPLSKSLFGDEGVAIATLLSAIFVPMLNILAVISLSIFGGKKPSVKKILLDIVKNPLIEAIALGLVVLFVKGTLVQNGVTLDNQLLSPLLKVFEFLSDLATPLALLMLGAQFEFSAVKELRKEIIFGCIVRNAVVPMLGIGVAYFFFRDIFGGAHFAAFVAAFATPVAVSSVPMTQEMGGDTTLAGQMVVWTTLLSVASVFLASFLLKLLNIF